MEKFGMFDIKEIKTMKFLIIQENGEHDANRSYRECFCAQRALNALNQECDVWGLNHVGWTKMPDFNFYDIIILLENYDKGWLAQLPLRDFKGIKLLWAIDAHCRGIQYYQNVFQYFDMTYCLQATKDYINDIPNSSWFPNCFDDTLIKPLSNVEKTVDVGFCGNYTNRKPWLDYLEGVVPLKQDIFVIGDEMVKAINSYKIHWNKNLGCDINYRNFETIGCGTLLLTDYNWQYKDLGFKHNENTVFYNSPTDCVIKIKELLANPDEMGRIAQNGYELSKKHTYIERMKGLLSFLSR